MFLRFIVKEKIEVKVAISWTKNILFAAVILLVLCQGYFYLGNRKYAAIAPFIFRYKLMTVLSGSMEPAIKPGDMIIDNSLNTKSIKEGDVVTYKDNNNVLITHRVVEIQDKEGQMYFKTKGDANNVEDAKLVPQGDVVGRLILRIPYGGYVSQFINSRLGIIIFILIPILILLIDQVMTVLLELKKEKTSESKQ